MELGGTVPNSPVVIAYDADSGASALPLSASMRTWGCKWGRNFRRRRNDALLAQRGDQIPAGVGAKADELAALLLKELLAARGMS